MPDPLFAELYRDTEHLVWPSAEQVRQRGRRRTRRNRLLAALTSAVAVAAVGTGAVTLAGRPDVPPPPPTAAPRPSTTPDPSTTATPTAAPSTPSRPSSPPPSALGQTKSVPSAAVPAAAMFQVADLPDGFEAVEPEFRGEDSLWHVTTLFDCAARPKVWRVVGSRQRTLASGTEVVTQEVTRHSGDGAATMMADARRLARDCAPERPGDSITVLADGLGGAESLLIGATVEDREYRWILVRQGDLVSQMPEHSFGVQISEAEARDTAHKVAARLCAGTDAC